MSTSPQDFNARIIEEFRANQGVVGGPFEGATLLLLHHVGARSGKDRINPLVYNRDGDRYVVFASKAGAPTNPDSYHNLKANPNTTIEVGTDTIDVVASEASGEVMRGYQGLAARQARSPMQPCTHSTISSAYCRTIGTYASQIACTTRAKL